MTIRRKILLIEAVAFLLAFPGLLAVFYLAFAYPYSVMDRDAAREDYERVRNAIADRIATVEVAVGDWALWDDTYEFIADGNPGYIEANLTDSVFSNLGLHLMVFLDTDGEVVHIEAFDLEAGSPMDPPDDLVGAIGAASPLVEFPPGVEARSGLLMLQSGPILVASHPILTSEGEGPSRGTLIFGRPLDDAEIQRIKEAVRLPFTVFEADAPDLPDDVGEAVARLESGAGDTVEDFRGGDLITTGLLADLHGSPALVMQVQTPRLAYQGGQLALRAAIVTFIVFGAVIGKFGLVMADRIVVSRIARLTSRTLEIAASGDSSARIHVEGSDELPRLAEAINKMLTTIGESQSALRASEERFQAFFTGADVGIYVKDLALRYTLVNPAMAAILGRDPVDVVFHTDQELLRDAEEAERQRVIDLRGISGEVTHDEREIAVEGGSRVFQRASGPVRGQGGSIIGVYGILRDVTDVRQAEDELRRLRDLHESIIRTALEGIVVQDAEGRFVFLNPAAERMLGYSLSELIGVSWTRVVPDDQQALVREADERRARGLADRYEIEIAGKDGVRFPVMVSGSPIFSEDGRFAGTLAVFFDISDIKRAQRELEGYHHRFLAVLDGLDADVYVADMMTYEILFMNRHMRESFGSDLVGKTCWQVFRNASAPCEHCTNPRLLASGPAGGLVITWEGQNPVTGRHYLNYDRAIEWVDGRAVRLQLATDITERKRAEEALRESERKYRTLFDQVADPVIVVDQETMRIVDCNEVALAVYGYSREELSAMGPHDLVADEEREKVIATAASQRVPRSVTGVHQTKAGKRMDVEILSDELSYQGRPAWISIIRDITELKKEEMRLSRLANFDPLTGLANPLLFDDRIHQAMARSERSGESLALLYIDLDRFKDVNDRFGHAAGNDLLRQVAARLEGSVRKVDTVARLGGDEFTVILEGIRQPQDAAGVARKVLDRMRAPFSLGGREVTVTTSIGLALFPQDAQSADGLLRCADIALYHAKGKGRDAVASFTPGMGSQGRRPSTSIAPGDQ